MLRGLLFVTVVTGMEEYANVSCFVGNPSSSRIHLERKQLNRMCSVVAEDVSKTFAFEQRTCPSSGCHLDSAGYVYCCCETQLCNTLSFFYVNRTRVYASQFIAQIFVFITVITKLLILLIINYGCIHAYDKRPRFYDRIHLDYTQFLIQPRLSVTEANNVIETIKKAPEPLSSTFEKINMNAVLTYSTTDRITYRETKEQAKLDNIDESTPMENILFTLIRLGPCEIDWDGEVVLAILDAAYKTFSDEPTLLELSAPITIYGDIHGQYSDVWRWFHVNGWPPKTRCLFLGDYVDRGRHSTEVLVFLLLLKVVMPKSVYLIRGNHEDPPVNKTYNFRSEVKTRFNKNVFKKLCRKIGNVFSVMPIACLINEQIICMHGGLSPRIQTVADIAALRKPLVTSDKHNMHIDIMWSDPHVDVWSFGPNFFRDPVGVGVGYVFGPIQIKRFVKKNKLTLVVRGHQPPMSGYERVGKHLLTLFSTAAYRVQNSVGNMGASLVIDEDGGMNIIRIQPGEQLKLKRQRYKMDKGDRYRDCGKPKLKREQDATDDRYD